MVCIMYDDALHTQRVLLESNLSIEDIVDLALDVPSDELAIRASQLLRDRLFDRPHCALTTRVPSGSIYIAITLHANAASPEARVVT